MKKVSSLVENYIVRRTTTMLDDKDTPVRVVASRTDTPLKPSNRWEPIKKNMLSKRFEFRDFEQRDMFIFDVLEFEKDKPRRGRMIIDNLIVTLEVGKEDLDEISDLDKEYARETDIIYREVCYV